jgi:hypothetical protein
MQGFGPTEGTPVHTNMLIIGNDPVATDSTAARIVGFNPKSISHLKYATKHGVGSMENIDILNTSNLAFSFEFVPKMAYRLSNLGLKFQRYGQYLVNLASLIEKIRSAMCTVGISYVEQKVTYGYAMGTVNRWIFKKDG